MVKVKSVLPWQQSPTTRYYVVAEGDNVDSAYGSLVLSFIDEYNSVSSEL